MRTMLPLLLLIPSLLAPVPWAASATHTNKTMAVHLALEAIGRARLMAPPRIAGDRLMAWDDCVRLFDDNEERLKRLVVVGGGGDDDAVTWLSAAVTAHGTCLDGLREMNVRAGLQELDGVVAVLRMVLAVHAPTMHEMHNQKAEARIHQMGQLESWNADKADIVVAQDGSGNYKTINEAVTALGKWQQTGSRRLVIYIKSGVYSEYVNIDRNLRNILLIGDGIDKTIITGSHSIPDGYTTFGSATFSNIPRTKIDKINFTTNKQKNATNTRQLFYFAAGVSGDDFWAQDMTFENTAGPEKRQAVALVVAADHSVFHRCSFKGYQDTLFVHSFRQFYRECDIYGTIDFIFGNAAVVLQNCNIYVRKPMEHQSNMITAQGRDDPNQNTGISIDKSMIAPAGDLKELKGSFRSYLGRPWKKYSRTVILKTNLDSLIHPEGWARWDGNFALDTLYYGEYMNTGEGASTSSRVNWAGFHVLSDPTEADPFTVSSFIQGQSWIPGSGVPFEPGL